MVSSVSTMDQFFMIPGARIDLRDFTDAHTSDYLEYQNPRHRWHEFDAPYYSKLGNQPEKMAELHENIQSQKLRNPRSRMAIVDRKTEKLIGSVNSYWESIETQWLSLGIGIYDESFWGQKIGTEALTLWTQYQFQARPELVRLDLRTWSGNTGMIQLARKLGFKEEARFRKARMVRGKYFDSLGFGILREEWNALYPG